MSASLKNEKRVALVTGSGKGVGAGIVKVLCKNGIRCCINCNSNPQMAEKTLAAIEAEGGEAFIFQADVTNEEQLGNMVRAIIEKWGRLDILVNNAAMQPNKFIDEYDLPTLQRIWDINIGGYVKAVQHCLPHLRKSPMARIVNISSIHGKRPTNFDAGYAMTKGAIRQFTRELSLELFPDNIPVNTIDLGGCVIEFKTGNPRMAFNSPIDTRSPNMKGGNRQVFPEEVGELVWYLCTEKADAITGAGIRIDRGLVLT
ncbi:MAG: SDR family oxidoreductase [Clostridia bacterium]|nr:SDR family oxidoreductase [Clostridia bacterium]